MSGWLDTLFANLPQRTAKQPSSRGAILGAGYQDMPASPNIDDRRQQPIDQAYWMQRAPGAASSQYPPSEMSGAPSGFVSTPGYDPMPLAGYLRAYPPSIHPPISPGDPGWTSPPSPSGPHNPQGDPNRPGYGAAIGMPNSFAPGMTLNSYPWGWR